ncbi:MAG TPA: hypothetical protein VF032_04605 [Thermoleophilaceae bacterium]
MRATAAITIRRAHPEEPGVLRVAALDSSRVPVAPLLVAEVDGHVRAAVSLEDGRTIADPFYATLDLVALLKAHAAATRRPAPRLLKRLRLRSAA